jgi:hypothetical protein
MDMKRKQHLLTATFAMAGILALGQAALAAKMHNHHNGKQLLGENLKKDGHHEIDHKGKYHAAAETKGGKIARFHVVHETKGEIPVKKYKTHKKMAQAAGAHLVNVSFALPQDQMVDMGTVYIGYSYIDDDGNEEIYWFPEDEILDADTGAVEYVSES